MGAISEQTAGDAAHATAVSVMNKVTLGTAGGTVLLGMTANELAALTGAVCAVLTLLISSAMTWHFKTKELELKREALRQHVEIEGEEDRHA